MRLANLAMELIIVALAVVGGYTIAGWIGVAVVIAFLITIIAELAIQLRSPKARALRQIARAMRDYEVMAVQIEQHVHTDECRPADEYDSSAPIDFPSSTTEE